MANQKSPKTRNLWFERLMAMIATVNLCLVLFNLSYVPWRDFYLRKLPEITQIYDPIKGIELQRETGNYLATVKELEETGKPNGVTVASGRKKTRRNTRSQR